MFNFNFKFNISYNFIYLFIILFIAILVPMLYSSIFLSKESYTNLGDFISPYTNEYNKEYNNINGASNVKVHQSHNYGHYPSSEDGGLVSDSFPSTNNKNVSSYQEQMMWWHYPVFKVGSYEQITNNLKYPNNPDVGQCMPADFCGTLYKEFQPQLNEAQVLPPVTRSCNGTRVNYFNTAPNMLTFKNLTTNILY